MSISLHKWPVKKWIHIEVILAEIFINSCFVWSQKFANAEQFLGSAIEQKSNVFATNSFSSPWFKNLKQGMTMLVVIIRSYM